MALNPNLTTDVGGGANLIKTYYDRRLLDRLQKELMFDQWADKKEMPKNSGKTIEFTRYEHLTGTPLTPLAEGVVGNGRPITTTKMTATPLQYGSFVSVSDELVLTKIDPDMKEINDILAYEASLVIDTLIRNALHANVLIQYCGGVLAENDALLGVVTAAELRKAVKTLKVNNTKAFSDGFAALVHPATSFDLQSDTAAGGWLDINKYTTTGPAYKGEVGKLYSTRVNESTNVEAGAYGNLGSTTYRNFIFSKGAYALVDLAGKAKPQTFYKQLGSSGVADPLDQLATVGYKFWHVTKVLDANRAIELIGKSNA
jgi:N4-gp56 family major capsid protein